MHILIELILVNATPEMNIKFSLYFFSFAFFSQIEVGKI